MCQSRVVLWCMRLSYNFSAKSEDTQIVPIDRSVRPSSTAATTLVLLLLRTWHAFIPDWPTLAQYRCSSRYVNSECCMVFNLLQRVAWYSTSFSFLKLLLWPWQEYLPVARPVACNELLLLKHLCGLPEDKYAMVSVYH